MPVTTPWSSIRPGELDARGAIGLGSLPLGIAAFRSNRSHKLANYTLLVAAAAVLRECLRANRNQVIYRGENLCHGFCIALRCICNGRSPHMCACTLTVPRTYDSSQLAQRQPLYVQDSRCDTKLVSKRLCISPVDLLLYC